MQQYPDDVPEADIEEVRRDSGGDRVPPHSIELEQQVIGAMLLSITATPKAMAIVNDQDFYRGRHRELFKALVWLFEMGQPADLPLIADRLDKLGILEECGGTPYLADVAAAVGTSVNVEHHARLLREKSVRRKIIALSSQLVTEAFEGGEDISDSFERFQQEMFNLTSDDEEGGLGKTAEVVAAENLARYEKGETWGELIPSAFPAMDSAYGAELDRKRMLDGGFMTRRLYFLVSDPSAGKTSAISQMVFNMAAQGFAISPKKPIARVACLVLEDAEEFISVMQAQRAMIPSNWSTLRYGEDPDPVNRTRIKSSIDDFKDLPIVVKSMRDPTLTKVVNWIRAVRLSYKVNTVIIDHLSMIDIGKRWLDALPDALGKLDVAAKVNDCAVIVAHHTNLDHDREMKTRKHIVIRPPSFSDIAGGASFSKYAYGIIYLQNPHAHKGHPAVIYDVDENVWPEGQARMGIMKNKRSGGGIIELWWRPKYRMFEPWAQNDMPQPNAPPPDEPEGPDSPKGEDQGEGDEDLPF